MVRDAKLVLVAEDDSQLQRLLARLLVNWGYEVISATTCVAAEQALARIPELVLLDLGLEDGSALELARTMAEMHPSPEVIVVSGTATPAEAFQLAQYGVRKYLQKPFGGAELRDAIREVLSKPADPAPYVRHAIPGSAMHDVLSAARWEMFDQAFSMTNGNYTRTAKILRVSRQAVQQIKRGRTNGNVRH